MSETVCCWTQDDDGNWATDCRELYVLITGTPNENRMRFCCYCGWPLVEQPAEPEPDEAKP